MAIRDDFESITESAPLVTELRARIGAGPLTFRDFMAAALYHPRHGYYTTSMGATSRGGDYVTSPEVHSIFGALVGKQIAELWRIMSRPDALDIVEAGAGSGLLARDVIAWARRSDAEFAASIRYRIVEPIPSLREVQRRTLDEAGIEGVEWLAGMPSDIDGVILSNELIDAFPVHRVVRHGDELREVYVTLDGSGRFVDHLAPTSDPAIQQYFDALCCLPGEGSYAEVNLDAVRWIADAAAALRRGYVMTFDYGYEAADLYAPWRRDGTLLCFYRQSASSDPYQRIGKQDMTSSVDFTTLRNAGEGAGLTTIAMTDQSSFLVRMGIGEAVAAIAEQRPGEMEEYFARRKVVMDLIDPGRLGRIKVLLQGKGVSATIPQGFRDA